MKKPEYTVVMRQYQNDGWDPDDRVGDAQVVAILEDPADADKVIRKDAKRKLKDLGVERADGEEDYDSFVEGAVGGLWVSATAGDFYRWVAESAKITPKKKGKEKE